MDNQYNDKETFPHDSKRSESFMWLGWASSMRSFAIGFFKLHNSTQLMHGVIKL